MTDYEIGHLDEDGVLIYVSACREADYVTDATRRTVRLEPNHDMRNKIGNYWWNYLRGVFEPVRQEPLETGEVDTSELVEGLVETVEDIAAHLSERQASPRMFSASMEHSAQFKLSPRMERVLKEYRRARPRNPGIPTE